MSPKNMNSSRPFVICVIILWIVGISLCFYFPLLQEIFWVTIGILALAFGFCIFGFFIWNKRHPSQPVLPSEIGNFYKLIQVAWGEELVLLGKLRAILRGYKIFDRGVNIAWLSGFLGSFLIGNFLLYEFNPQLLYPNINMNVVMLWGVFIPYFIFLFITTSLYSRQNSKIRCVLHDLTERSRALVDQALLLNLASYFDITYNRLLSLVAPSISTKMPVSSKQLTKNEVEIIEMGRWRVTERNPPLDSPFLRSEIFELNVDESGIVIYTVEHPVLFIPLDKISSVEKGESHQDVSNTYPESSFEILHVKGEPNRELIFVPNLLKEYSRGADFFFRYIQDRIGIVKKQNNSE